MKKNRGIGLLELMLSLAIIAVLLLMATRYFQSTRTSQQVNSAIGMLQTLVNASDNWKWTYGSYQSSTPFNIKNMVSEGMLPKDFASKNMNPWGGNLSANSVDEQHIVIRMTDVPSAACNGLSQLMKKRNLKGSCSGGTYSATYPSGAS